MNKSHEPPGAAGPDAEPASGTGQEVDKQIEIPDEIPILPLKNNVAFPGTIMPLNVVREKSHRVLDSVLTGDKIIGVVAQRLLWPRTAGELFRIRVSQQIDLALSLLRLQPTTDE